jgi:uncharacterized protein YbaA (DUF1428 family)
MSYVDFFSLPLPKGNEAEYKKMALVFAEVMKPLGMVKYVEALADDVPHGEVTDFYRAVAAKDDETIVAAFALWPDKETRDRAWAAGMQDPRMTEMEGHKRVFDGKRMFWGGFKALIEVG